MADTADKIKLIDNHVERAKDLLLFQFKDKTVINGIVDALVSEIQEVEDTLIELQTIRTLEEAEGVWLDAIGEKLKVRRNNLDDDDYKTAIKVRILRKKNKGTMGDISNIFRLLTKDPDPIVSQTHPYVVELCAVLACIAKTESGLDELLGLFPVNTGVRILNKPAQPFGFAGNPKAFPFSGKGFNPPQGQWVSLIRSSFGAYNDTRFIRVPNTPLPDAEPPVLISPPYIVYSSLEIGSVLTVNDGIWSGKEPITFQYQWFVDNAAVDGETNNTYTILLTDADKPIACRVIASNEDGQYQIITTSVTYVSPPVGGLVSGLGLPNNGYDFASYLGAPPYPVLSSSVTLLFQSDGTVQMTSENGATSSYDFLETTGAGLANDYEILVDKVSGDNLTLPPQIGIYQPLTSPRMFALSISTNFYGFTVVSGTFDITIRHKTTGVYETKRINLTAEVNIENNF